MVFGFDTYVLNWKKCICFT